MGFNTTGPRILGVEKQTCHLNNFNFITFCEQASSDFNVAHRMQIAGHSKNKMLSLSSYCLVQLHRLVPLLCAIFQTDPVSTKADNDSCRCVFDECLW